MHLHFVCRSATIIFMYLCIKSSVSCEKPKPKRKNVWIYVSFSSPDFFDHIFTLHALLLILELFFTLPGRNPTSCKSIQAFYILSLHFCAGEVPMHILCVSLLIFLCILNQQFCRLHITTSLRIFSFFNLDIKMVIFNFFLSQFLAGLFFCNSILFPY